jgi:carboxypeptidase family protein
MSMRKPFALITVIAPLALVACGGSSQAPPPPPSTTTAAPAGGAAATSTGGSGSISGKVTFTGTPPAPEKIKVSADPKCQELHKEGLERQSVRVKDGGLADTFVYLKSGVTGDFPAPTAEVVLDQHGCMYEPAMLGMQVNQPLKIRNSDDTLHNIHPRPTVNAEFNIGQPRKGMETTKTFDKEEVMIPVGCDVHPWMRAYISVLDNPFYAVTKDDGTFEIKGLPAGEYEIEAFHGKLKSQDQKVTVKDGETAALNFTFKG